MHNYWHDFITVYFNGAVLPIYKTIRGIKGTIFTYDLYIAVMKKNS